MNRARGSGRAGTQQKVKEMSLIRWSPRTELESFGRDPIFTRFFDLIDSEFAGRNSERPWCPPMDLVEEKDRLLAQVELPGIDPKSVQVSLQGDLLVIQAERRDEHDETQGRYLEREHAYGSFQRSVKLPYHVQADKVKAQYKNGIMTIVLPKAEEYVGRQIPVEVEKQVTH